MTCPGSTHLPADPGSDKSSEYAARGTAMHALSEKCLRGNTNPEDHLGEKIEGYRVDKQFVEICNVYVTFVRELPGFKVFEAKVGLEEVIADCFGTGDCLAMRPGHLTVVDLKTGAGVKVDAEDNTQLQCYGLGAFLKFDDVYDFETITMVIVQPPLDNISTWTITRQEMLAFADRLRAAERAMEETPDLFVASEKACRWCRGKTSCPEQRRLANEAAAIDFMEAKGDLAKYVGLIAQLRSFCDAVENAAKETILQGGSVPGWKVVEGRRTRAWKDEAETEHFLKEQGHGSIIYSEPKLLTVAQMEKALKKVDISIEHLVEVKTGNPTLAKESDKRSSLDKNAQAAKDFAM